MIKRSQTGTSLGKKHVWFATRIIIFYEDSQIGRSSMGQYTVGLKKAKFT